MPASRRYEGRRAGDYGTSIIVIPEQGDPYPLPYVDAYELERRVFGTPIPEADTPESRTFEWGYHGAGARDTAAALLADWFGDPQPMGVIQRFKDDVVASLGGAPRGAFEFPGGQIQAWATTNAALIDAKRAEQAELARWHNAGEEDALGDTKFSDN
jgi:hypothetical protein